MSGSGVPTRPVLARHVRYRWDAARGQHQLVYPEAVMELNETAAAIVKRLDGRTVEDLARELEGEFGEEGLAGDVASFLRELAGKGLVREG